MLIREISFLTAFNVLLPSDDCQTSTPPLAAPDVWSLVALATLLIRPVTLSSLVGTTYMCSLQTTQYARHSATNTTWAPQSTGRSRTLRHDACVLDEFPITCTPKPPRKSASEIPMAPSSSPPKLPSSNHEIQGTINPQHPQA